MDRSVRAGHDRIYHWELGSGDDAIAMDVPGHLTLGNTTVSIDMAIAGAGLFYCLKDRVTAQLESGALEVVLRNWTTPGPGFHASMHHIARYHLRLGYFLTT